MRCGVLLHRLLARREDHVERADRRRVGILDQPAGAVGEADAGRRLGADIGVDVAARERRRVVAERQADRLDVLDRHALHAQPLEDHGLLRRARPDRDLLALEILDGLDVGLDAGDHRHAAVVGVGDDHDRLAGGGAEQERGDAVDAGIDRAGEHRVLAVGRALERDDLHLVAGRDEFLVEIGRDAVDELERADLQDLVVLSLDLRRERRDSAATTTGSASLVSRASMVTPSGCRACPAACSISLA